MRFTGRRPTLDEIVNLGLPVFPVNIWWDKQKEKWQKTPAISKKMGGRGHHDAVAGEEARALFARAVDERGRARWNSVGVPTGARLGATVVDDDPRKGTAEWWARVGGFGTGRRHATWSGGSHLFFKYHSGLKTCSDRPVRGVDIRNDGGWVVWWPLHGGPVENSGDLPDLPKWFVEQVTVGVDAQPGKGGIEGGASELVTKHGTPPAHILGGKGQEKLAHRGLATQAPFELMPHNVARVRGALLAIDPLKLGRDEWLRLGMSLHSLQWDSNDGSDFGLELWDEFCRRSREHYNREGLETTWDSFGSYGGRELGIGTLFEIAHQHGWKGQVVMPTPVTVSDTGMVPPLEIGGEISGMINGSYTPVSSLMLPAPASVAGPIFVDVDKVGKARPTMTNSIIAIEHLGITCRKDTFHERMIVGGQAIDQWAGDLTDDAVLMLRTIIRDEHDFDAGTNNVRDAAVVLCLENQFNPVVDYLASLKWDGVLRINTWASTFLGAPDDPLTREFGRLMLIAAVRRARAPGTKFDEIVVLEGPQGLGKSTALRILAGDENFSDQEILTASVKEQQEAFQGVWIHEIGELAGIRRVDIERIKQFCSRTEDRARPAYGRFRVDMKRRGIFVGTTNDSMYLQDETGNRRFWPIECRSINLEGLRQWRDQLWAEAAYWETQGVSITLAEQYRGMATERQEARLEGDPWVEILSVALKDQTEVQIDELLRGKPFLMMSADVTRSHQQRCGKALRTLGFKRVRVRVSTTELRWKYFRVPS